MEFSVEGFRLLRSLHNLAMICRLPGYPLGLEVNPVYLK
jgi:hypothetical protein